MFYHEQRFFFDETIFIIILFFLLLFLSYWDDLFSVKSDPSSNLGSLITLPTWTPYSPSAAESVSCSFLLRNSLKKEEEGSQESDGSRDDIISSLSISFFGFTVNKTLMPFTLYYPYKPAFCYQLSSLKFFWKPRWLFENKNQNSRNCSQYVVDVIPFFIWDTLCFFSQLLFYSSYRPQQLRVDVLESSSYKNFLIKTKTFISNNSLVTFISSTSLFSFLRSRLHKPTTSFFGRDFFPTFVVVKLLVDPWRKS